MDETTNVVPVEPTPQPDQGASEVTSTSEAPTPDQSSAEFASQFAIISRREREQHLRDKDLGEREEHIKQQMVKVAEYEQNLVMAKQNPQEFLKQAGVNMAEVVNKEISGEVSGEVQLRSELERQRDEIQDLKKREEKRVEDAETSRLQNLRKTYVDQVVNWVDNRGDEFELVRKSGAYETVYQVLQQNYNETGKDIGFEAAAKIVNDHYAEELSRFSDTRTLKNLFDASAEKQSQAPSPAAIEGENKVPPSVKTLSNTQTAGTNTAPRVLTHNERLAKFADRLKWQ